MLQTTSPTDTPALDASQQDALQEIRAYLDDLAYGCVTAG
jgi:hypothetical protein